MNGWCEFKTEADALVFEVWALDHVRNAGAPDCAKATTLAPLKGGGFVRRAEGVVARALRDDPAAAAFLATFTADADGTPDFAEPDVD